MGIGSPVSALTGFGSTPPKVGDDSILNANSLGSNALGKDDFLKLLMTQMQHQDPLNPLDNAEFLSQLSQFSQLEQTYNINQNISDLTDSQSSIRDCLLSNLLGKTVMVTGPEIDLHNQDGVDLTFDLMDWAEKVTITINDADEHQVKTIQNLNQEGGLHNVHWDGTDNKGQKVAEGNYTFTVTAFNDEESVRATPYMTGQVSEIIFSKEEGPLVQLENQKVPISNIFQIIDHGGTVLETET
jgi:flagellar basal-body rod modification protein FlgD